VLRAFYEHSTSTSTKGELAKEEDPENDPSEHMSIIPKNLGNLYIRNSASESKSEGSWENFVNVSHPP